MATTTTTPRVEETDSLANLEERIARAVHLITQLRQERDSAVAERNSALASVREEYKHELDRLAGERDQMQAENARLAEELQHLRADRKQVRTRIEKLLGQMDLLSGS